MSTSRDNDARAGGGSSPVPYDRRVNQKDRRALTLRTLLTGGFSPRRRMGRRASDHEVPVDFHEPALLSLAVAMLILSVADAFLTVRLLHGGAYETNPLLAVILADHPDLFAVVKMALTGFGVLLLVATARARLFKLVRVKAFLQALLVAYFALVAYEAWLVKTML